MKPLKLISIVITLLSCINISAQKYVSTDAKNVIEFYGDHIRYDGKVIKLGPKSLFIDGQLSDNEANKYLYVFNSFQSAAKKFIDGTEKEPMNVYIAPWVYWIDDPDDPAIRVGEKGKQPTAMTVKCEYLHLTGLNPDAHNVVLAVQRGQTQGAIGNYLMFDFYGDGLTIKDMTLGNFCNVDLDFPLKPALSRKKRMPAITQAHVANCHGDKAFAQNVRFISRLNMTPLSGARRLLFDHCHLESTDDALAGTGVYLHCTLDFYGQKPFYATDSCGAVFLDCDFSVCHDVDRQYFCKAVAPLSVIDCRFHGTKSFYAGWTHAPEDWLRCYQYDVTLNNQPYIIGADKPFNTVCLDQKPMLGAYRLMDGKDTIYNTYNLLRGTDEWDPMAIRTKIEQLSERDGRDYSNMATALIVSPKTSSIRTGYAPVTLNASLMRHSGYLLNNAKVMWKVESGKEKYVSLSTKEGNECVVTPLNDDDMTQDVDIIAYTDDGAEGCAQLKVAPKMMQAPQFVSQPKIIITKGWARVDYKLDLQGRKDESLITWYRIVGDREIPVSVSRMGIPEYSYRLQKEDVGYRLGVEVRPKQVRSESGTGVKADMKRTVKGGEADMTDTLDTDFRNFPTAVQHDIIPGFWTVDSYKPADTEAYGWDIRPQEEYWRYGEGINGCVGTGLYGLDQGARLMFTPIDSQYGDMTMTVKIDPSKTSGQGFSSATGQYLDLYIKFDTRSLNGYGVRIIRTTKYSNAVDFMLVKCTNGVVSPISEPVSTICYITGCTITLQSRGNQLTAHAETSSALPAVSDSKLQKVVDMKAMISDNNNGGIGILYTGRAGEGANMLHKLTVITEKKK